MKLPKDYFQTHFRTILIICASFLLCTGCRTKATVLAWDTAKVSSDFPESKLKLPSSGVCFSGGGTRAMNCAIGQLRGLQEADLFGDIGYISAVSGGSWAASIFTYYQSGAANDRQLLGDTIAPDSITMDKLKHMPEGFMGEVITRSLEADLFERLGLNLLSVGALQKMDFIWIDGVGHTYLKPFGLYNPENPKYFTLDTTTRDSIIKRNPKLKKNDFIHVRNEDGGIKRPFLVINSSLLAPAKDLPLKNPENLSVFNYTPLYIGSNVGMRITDTNLITKESVSFDVGGGFIEPFGFGGDYLSSHSVFNPGNEASRLRVKLAKKRFEVVDATGTSSSAFGAAVSSSILAQLPSDVLPGFSLDNLIPEEEYWPFKADGEVGTQQTYRYTDGGNLENYGLISLLQRGVQNIVVFINTDTPLSVDCNPSPTSPPLASEVDSDLYPLFGYKFGNHINNQVFTTEDFTTVYDGLKRAKLDGGTVMTKTSLTTVENKWWGIPEGQPVEILWVYNERVPEWEDLLQQPVKDKINEGLTGPFPNFPQYKLIFENGFFAGISYTKQQVNLLYQLSAWNVYHNKAAFEFLREGN